MNKMTISKVPQQATASPALRPAGEIPDYAGKFPPALLLVRPPHKPLEEIVATGRFAHPEVQLGISSVLDGTAYVRYLSINSTHIRTGFYPHGKDLMLHLGGNVPPAETDPNANFAMRQFGSPLYFAKQGRQLSLGGAVQVISSVAKSEPDRYVVVIVGQEVPFEKRVRLQEGIRSYDVPKRPAKPFIPRGSWRRNLPYETKRDTFIIFPKVEFGAEFTVSEGTTPGSYSVRKECASSGFEVVMSGDAESVAEQLVEGLDGTKRIILRFNGTPSYSLRNHIVPRLSRFGPVENPNR